MKVSPAMAVGSTVTLRDMEWIVSLIDECAPQPNRPKMCKKKSKEQPGK